MIIRCCGLFFKNDLLYSYNSKASGIQRGIHCLLMNLVFLVTCPSEILFKCNSNRKEAVRPWCDLDLVWIISKI